MKRNIIVDKIVAKRVEVRAKKKHRKQRAHCRIEALIFETTKTK